MTGAIILRGVFIYALLGWKSYQLSRAGHDRPLRCVVAIFACAGAAWPVGLAYDLRAVPSGARWLMFAQPASVLGCLCSLDLFLLYSLLPPARARQLAARRAAALAITAAAMATAARAAPHPGIAGAAREAMSAASLIHLLFEAAIAGFLADSWLWARRGIPQADQHGARALRTASAGLALMTAGIAPLTADTAIRITGSIPPPALPRTGQWLAMTGVLVFLAGIAYPAAADRIAAIGAWTRHRRTYADLGPLWTALYPDGTVPPARLPPTRWTRWTRALAPWQARRRLVRRVLEIRDGLVRLSPYIAEPGNDDPEDLAARLLTVLRTADPEHLPPRKAVPIAVPRSPGPGTSFDADAAELVRLSRTIRAAQARDHI